MDSTPEDEGRDIPRPKPRTKHTPPRDVTALPSPAIPPTPKPAEVGPDFHATVANSIDDVAPSPLVSGQLTGVSLSAADAAVGFMTKKDYIELLKMRVESQKAYPESALEKGLRGVVVVRFLMNSDGTVSELAVHQSSGAVALDDSALSAVRSSAPFPSPPSGMFHYPLKMQLSISFELT
jgi:protein TonB